VKDYKTLITEKVKPEIEKRIQKLRSRYIELSDDWHIEFPKGFKPGRNDVPVICKNGNQERIIASLQFELGEDLDLNIDDIDVADEDRIWHPPKEAELNESLDILNHVIVSLNEFIQGLTITLPNKQLSLFPSMLPRSESGSVVDLGIERIREEISESEYLPMWFTQIHDSSVREKLLRKLAEAYQQYRHSASGDPSLKSFFEKYTMHLKSQGHLYHHCPYKGKRVNLDAEGHCSETYCSKKPYHSRCTQPMLKFGKEE
jgi:hypothetical protein